MRGIRSRPTPKGEIEGDQVQAHTQVGNGGGSDPGPHPRGKLRGIRSRPTPNGEMEGDQIQAPTPTPGSRHPPPADTPQETATAADGTHPTGMHSCNEIILFQNATKHSRKLSAISFAVLTK